MEYIREPNSASNVPKESKPKMDVMVNDHLTNLKLIYSQSTKKSLYEIASLVNLKGRSKMNKDDLVEAMYKYMTNYSILEDILIHCQNDEWQLFCEILEKGESSFLSNEYEYSFFVTIGMFVLISISQRETKNSYKLMLSKEIRAVIETNTPRLIQTVNRYHLIRKYIRSMITLYGAVEIEKAIEIFNQFNNEMTNIIEIQKIEDDDFYKFKGNYIFSSIFQDDEEVKAFLEMRLSKMYYIPSVDQFLLYEKNKKFQSNPQRIALKGFLLNTSSEISELEIDKLIDEIQFNLSIGKEFHKVMSIFNDWNIIFNNEKDIHIVMNLVLEVSNTTRMWLNRGYTPREIHMAERSNVLMSANPMNIPIKNFIHIGRNDPCPCGSGRKYKKCCIDNR